MVALSFASDAEANIFYKTATATVINRTKRRRSRKFSPTKAETNQENGVDSSVLLRNPIGTVFFFYLHQASLLLIWVCSDIILRFLITFSLFVISFWSLQLPYLTNDIWTICWQEYFVCGTFYGYCDFVGFFGFHLCSDAILHGRTTQLQYRLQDLYMKTLRKE